MRKIQIFSDRLKERLANKLEADDQHYFSRIIQATQRMNILIDDLLLYSHVSSGAVLEEQINLNDKVKLVLEDLEVEIAEKKASVTVDPLPTIRGHRRQLQQLFQNLIGNAIKYAKPGIPPQVHISSRPVQPGETGFPIPIDKAYHLIEVSDNGIGFSQEDAIRIFHVFTRLHGMAEYKGTGVGLSIAQKVVENHGGAIWAEGIPDAGARFKVLLPA
jgi:signal transduction histidine kinase